MCPGIDACGIVIGGPDVCQLSLHSYVESVVLDAGQMLTDVLKCRVF